LPESLVHLLESMPGNTHPMDVLRTTCSFLGTIEPQTDTHPPRQIVDRLLALFPAALLYWYHYHQQGTRLNVLNNAPDLPTYFLTLLHGNRFDPKSALGKQQIQTLKISLILYAEHEFNASTFAARVCAATLSDLYSAVTAAIGTLRGPLHGGANEAAMLLISEYADVNAAEVGIKAKLYRQGCNNPKRTIHRWHEEKHQREERSDDCLKNHGAHGSLMLIQLL
jgi:2-methylcitrate synthase